MTRTGFFMAEEPVEAPAPRKTNNARGCGACALKSATRFPVMGQGARGILILVPTPTEDDFDRGALLSGATGAIIKSAFKDSKIDIKRDCWLASTVQCRASGSKDVQRYSRTCSSELEKIIEDKDPKVIIAIGGRTLLNILGDRLTGRARSYSPSAWEGELIPDQKLKRWIQVTTDPNFIISRKDRRNGNLPRDLLVMLRRQIKTATTVLNKDVPDYNVEGRLKTLFSPDDAIKVLDHLNSTASLIAFDYETTGIKPHRAGHHIVSMSVSDGMTGWGFPYYANHPGFLISVRRLLTNEKVKKIAHQGAFENGWTYVRGAFKVPTFIKGWGWDTITGAHCVNNKKPTGLKFLSYAKLGIIGFDAVVDKFITTSQEPEKGPEGRGTNRFNNILDAPMEPLCEYNAEDSLLDVWIYRNQLHALKGRRRAGQRLLIDGMEALSHVEQRGFNLDMDYLVALTEELTVKRNSLVKRAKRDKDAKLFPGDFEPLNNTHVEKLLYDVLKLPVPEGLEKGDKKTDKGQDKRDPVDKTALQKIGLPICAKVLAARRIDKALGTYVAQYTREEVGGVVRPFYPLYKVDSFRSSCEDPNMQNVPKRDKQIKEMIRALWKPSRGRRFIEWDYKSLEVVIAACVFQDPALIKYVTDESTDMHRDVAMDLFMYTLREWGQLSYAKILRQASKNGYVFPAFYGSSGKNAARGIWEQVPVEEKRRVLMKLDNKNPTKWLDASHQELDSARALVIWTDHVKAYDRKFWGERFKVYADKKRINEENYMTKGYLDTVTGFRIQGPMGFTELNNYVVQGPAFHCLLWTLINVNREVEDSFPKTDIVGETHDSMMADADPDDEEELDAIVKDYGTKKIREHWDWLIVPLTLEKERSEVNGSLAVMNDCGVL